MTGSRTEIEFPIKNLCSIKIHALVKIAKSINTGQILNLEYLVVDSLSIESVVDGKLLDENRIRFLASISTFCLFIERISNEKEHGKGINQLMPHFVNNGFLKSNEEVQHITRINTQKPILHFANNTVIFKNNSVGKPNINVGPSLPFHPLHFLFFHSFQIALRVQKISSSTQTLVFGKMRRGVNKVEVERFAQLGRDGQNFAIKHKEEEEGTEMGIELENETRKIVSFSCGGRLMFS